MRKQRVIFSLQAWRTFLSFKPPSELKRKSGAHKVTRIEKNVQRSKPDLEVSAKATAPGEEERWAAGGLMRGTGATLRSGRVRVFARRMVAPLGGGGRVVGMGMSVKSWFVWKRRVVAMIKGETAAKRGGRRRRRY